MRGSRMSENKPQRRYHLLSQLEETEAKISQTWSSLGPDMARLRELATAQVELRLALSQLERESG